MKKKNERLVMAYILQAVNFGEIYEVKNYPVKLNINWYEQNSRRDVDNVTFATKFIQDSLVRTGILEDDSRKYINQVNHSVFTDKENPRIKFFMNNKKVFIGMPIKVIPSIQIIII